MIAALLGLGIGCGDAADAPLRDAMPQDAPDAAPRDAVVPDAGIDAGADAEAASACPAPEPCDPVEPAGCEGDGTCVLTSAEPSCSAEAGEVGRGEPCTAAGQCAAGLACFQTREEAGRCDRLCCSDEGCTEGERCGAGRLLDGTEVRWGRCRPWTQPCDLLDPEASCEPAEACYPVRATGDDADRTACLAAGDGMAGDGCSVQNDCAPGLTCRGLAPNMRCRRLCDLENPDCGSTEGTCREQPDLPSGVGICGVDLTTYLE